MKPYAFIVDDFLSHFDQWRQWCDGLSYSDATNPVDQVSYPGIYKDVPTYGVKQRLSYLLGPIVVNTCFLRLSIAGVHVPNVAHTDDSMGEWSLMLYMNRHEHCAGGTALLRHRDGGEANTGEAEQASRWAADANKLGAWEQVMSVPMRSNRAFIFPANLAHCAIPVGGFGDDATDGRLVLTCFFTRSA